MPEVELPNGWRPRGYQRPAWDALEKGKKRAFLAWHRRAGKDDVALHRAAVAAFERVGVYWHMLPEASQARKAVWEAVNPHSGMRRIDEAFPLALREVTRENEMFIRFKNGATWQLVGSDNFNSLVGSPPIGIVFSEWALANPSAWAYLRPILAENGGWALFITTPRGKNHAATMYKAAEKDPAWFVQKLTADQTDVFSPETLATERAEMVREYGQTFGEAQFQQEYFCSFESAIMGAYYASDMIAAENEKRITNVPWERGAQVTTAWDLGVGDSTAIWFAQQVGKEVRIIDFYEASGVGLDHYAKVLREKPYTYGEHLLPHDVEHKEMSTGRTRKETLEGLGFAVTVVPKLGVDEGINAVRMLLPRCWFDEAKCATGIEALRQYRTEYDDRMKVFRPKPLHDWTSHAADALRYLAVGLQPVAKKTALKIRYDWVV